MLLFCLSERAGKRESRQLPTAVVVGGAALQEHLPRLQPASVDHRLTGTRDKIAIRRKLSGGSSGETKQDE